VCDIVVKKFTFAISFLDEFLFCDRLVATSVCISRIVSMLFFTNVFLVILFCLSLFHIFFAAVLIYGE